MSKVDEQSDATTPAVIYAAKSTQDKHNSIGTQIAECKQMAAENGWVVLDVFSDEGFSAYSGNRGPGLADARAAAASAAAKYGTVAMLVAQAHDRFARGAGDRPGAPESLGEIWHAMRRLDVHLRTVEDDEELRDEASVAAIGRRAYIDSQRKAKSVRKGMRRRAADRAKHNGGPRPYGYERVGPRGDTRLDVVPREAEVIRRIFAAYLSGESLKAVGRGLDNAGIPAAISKWHGTGVQRVVTNPLYIGKVRYEGTLYEGEHEAIISDDDFAAAQVMLKANARPGGGGGRPAAGPHLMVAGLLHCARCGGSMKARTQKRVSGRGVYSVYECSTHDRNPASCPQTPVSQADLDAALLGEFERTHLDAQATAARIRAKLASDHAVIVEMLADAERSERKATTALERAKRDYREGTLPAALYTEQYRELTEELAAAEAQAEQHRQRARELASGDMTDADAELLRQLSDLRDEILGANRGAPGSLQALRRTVRRLFTAVVFWPADLADDDRLASAQRLGIEPDALVAPPAWIDGHGSAAHLVPILSRSAWTDEPDGPMLRRVELPAPSGCRAGRRG